MKIAAHIPFFFNHNRLQYLIQVIEGLNNFDELPEIFIYSNKSIKQLAKYKNVRVKKYRYLQNGRWQFRHTQLGFKIGLRCIRHSFYLTWECRSVIKKYIKNFDVQIYLEDDILFTKENLEYWFLNKDSLVNNGYNLGFLRVENDDSGNLFCSDLWSKPSKIIEIQGRKYLVNDINPYCAFWIYDKKELLEFTKSKEWKFNFLRYNIREKSAIGWHGKDMDRYKDTLLPLVQSENGYKVPYSCAVHHLPNNYIGHEAFCTIKFPLEYLYVKSEGDFF